MTWLVSFVAAVAFCLPVQAQDLPWSGLAGMQEETQARELLLRDELVAAGSAYAAALQQAAAQAADQKLPNRPAAWARVEYLMEQLYALAMEDAAAGDAFLAVADSLAGADAQDGPDIAQIRARARWLGARLLERRGRADDARKRTEGLGFLRQWLLLGPLESEAEAEPEPPAPGQFYAALAANAPIRGKNGPAHWRMVTTDDALGRVMLQAYMRTPGAKGACLLTLVHVEEPQDAVLHFGAETPAVVWCNMRQGRFDAAGRAQDPDRCIMPVRLHSGWNTLAVHTVSRPHAWSFSLRITQPDGRPLDCRLPDMTAEEVLALAARTQGEEAPEQTQRIALGAVSILEDWLAEHPDDPQGALYLAGCLFARGQGGEQARRRREEIFGRVLELTDFDPFATLMAARSIDSGMEGPDREENMRIVLLHRARSQGSAAALVDTGRLYLDIMRQPSRAAEFATLALQINPLSNRAKLLEYDIAAARGWWPAADRMLAEFLVRHPLALGGHVRAGARAVERGQYKRALEELHAVLALDAANRQALNGAVDALSRLGQTSAAVNLLSSHIRNFPYDMDMRLRLARLYADTGRTEQALQQLEQITAMAPDDAAAAALAASLTKADAIDAQFSGMEVLRPRMMDLSPAAIAPDAGWEYLYYQTADVMHPDARFERTVSFCIRIYTAQAGSIVRRLSGFGDGMRLVRLVVTDPDGGAEELDVASLPEGEVLLPPLPPGSMLEVVAKGVQRPNPWLEGYIGFVVPLAQRAPARLSQYIMIIPREMQIHTLPVNGAPRALVLDSMDGKSITRIWEMSNLPACADEPLAASQDVANPCVQVSSFADWDEFARWYWRLMGSQYYAPPELSRLAARIAGDAELPLDKLDRAAQWVARAISPRQWAAGMYAYRPLNVRSVLSRRAADSKDRALLLCLLAREYGLEAWPVFTRSRDGVFGGADDIALPILDHFNYCTVLVAAQGGDVFLDAGNIWRNPGVPSSRTQGETGIVLRDGSAQKIVIPDDGALAASWEEQGELVLEANGSASWAVRVFGAGAAAEELRRRFGSDDSREERWQQQLAVQYSLPQSAGAEFSDDPAHPARAVFAARTALPEAAVLGNDRVMAAVPHAFAADGPPAVLWGLARAGLRSRDIVLPHGFRMARTLDISWPAGWRLVTMPQPLERAYPFGNAVLRVQPRPGGMVLAYELQIPGHRIAAKDFDAVREFAALAQSWLALNLVWEVE